MQLIPMRNIRASDNSDIHLECLPPLFLDRLRLLFLNQNKCCGYSKELSQTDGSDQHQKHMFKLTYKKL